MSIWNNSTKTVSKKPDDMIVRVNMEQDDISGRKAHLPGQDKSSDLTIQHVGKGSGSMK